MKFATAARVALVFMAVWVFTGVGAVQASEQRIGWVDAQRILDETQAGNRIKERVEAYRDSRQVVIDLEEEDIKSLESRLEQQMPLLSDDAKREKQIEFKQKLGRYQKKVMELSQELQDKKLELLDEFNSLLKAALEKVASDGGYTFIFDNGGESTLLYGDPSLDLTDQIKAEIDAK
jgi:outer membrane protein